MKNKIFYILIVIIAVASLWLIASERINNKSDGKNINNKQLKALKIGDKTILIEIAKTEKDREQGLSGKKNLPTEQGMLFAFDKPDFYSFWMKEMNFPIDIVWLDQGLKIVEITENFEPKTYPQTITSHYPAQYVLEINTKSVEKYGFKIGDVFILEQ